MDYKSMLAIAEQNKKSSRKSDGGQYLTTKLSAPKKEKKDSKTRSHVIQKLIEEKDKDKKKREEMEKQRKLMEEKKNRFVIPKRSDSPLASAAKEKMVPDVTVTPDHFVNKTITDLRKNEGTRAERIKTKITVEARLSLEEKRLKIIERLKNPEPEKHKDKLEKVQQDTEEKHKIQRDINESDHSEVKKRRTDTASKDGHRRKEKHSSKSTSKQKSESEKSRLDNETLKQNQQDKEVLKKQPAENFTKPKPKVKRPPPPDAGLSFADLLKMAEVKSKDPITMDMLLKKPKEEKIVSRPLTQKEKEHLLKEKESLDRKNGLKPLPKKETQLPQTEKVVGNNKGKEETVKNDISKSLESTKKSSLIVSSGNGQNSVAHSFKDKHGNRTSEKFLKQNLDAKCNNGIKISEKVVEQKPKTNAKNEIRTNEKVLEQKPQTRKEEVIKQEQSLKRNHQGQRIVDSMTGKGDKKTLSGTSKNSMNKGLGKSNVNGDNVQKTNMNTKAIPRKESKQAPRLFSKDSNYDEEHENILVCRPTSKEKQQEKKPEKDKQQETRKEKDNSKPKAKPVQESSNPWDRIYGQIKANNPKSGKKRLVIESDDEDEYDDNDSFIDDGDDENGNDYSKYIKEIFGYDKNRFKDDDDDVDNMESNFAQVEKEERISARIGLQEDLEDMRKEEEELRQKMLAKKKKLKK